MISHIIHKAHEYNIVTNAQINILTLNTINSISQHYLFEPTPIFKKF